VAVTLLAVKATSTSPELSVEVELSVQDELAMQEPTEGFKSPANQEQELQVRWVVEAKPTEAPLEQPPQEEPIESKYLVYS
jgi:hypothetical protein